MREVKITGVRIRNFRTIGSQEQSIALDRPATLVGANNSGKTNIMRAIEMFFTGHDNARHYDPARDLPFGKSNVKTSIVAAFEGDDTGSVSGDKSIYDQYDRLHALYGRQRQDASITLHLVFAPSGTPVYQFFPNAKKPSDAASQAAISRTQRQLVTDLLGLFRCHYIPSAKSIQQLYDEFLNPFIRAVAAQALAPQMSQLLQDLGKISSSIDAELAASGLGDLHASFDLPFGSIEHLMSRFDFNMKDPHETPIVQKGQGIQSAAFLAALQWVTTEEASAGAETVWLLEEPEAYLHPQLMGSVRSMLDRLSANSTVVVSTHSLSFVPADPSQILGTVQNSQGSEVRTYSTYTEATADIRRNLGVRFSDYYNLTEYNVAVEGKSDRAMIEWALGKSSAALPRLRAASILDFGGVKFLSGWLRATYEHIRRERAIVALFDGDLAGEKERRDLRSFFGRMNVPWQSNAQYVLARAGYPIEAVFPDDWLAILNEEHPSWFDDFALDPSRTLHAFVVNDSKKDQLQNWLMRKADSETDNEWLARWDALLEALEDGLEAQERALARLIAKEA